MRGPSGKRARSASGADLLREDSPANSSPPRKRRLALSRNLLSPGERVSANVDTDNVDAGYRRRVTSPSTTRVSG